MRRLRIVLSVAATIAMPVQLAVAASIDWSHAELVRVLLVDDKFVPDKLSFQHDVAYRLHLENQGKEMHEFTAPAFFAQATLRDPSNLANGGQDIVVQPGAVADILLVPRKPGSYRLICADHDWAGMTGEIVVQ